ncbi:MAG: acetyl-CoA carboxylase biotin carboxyl carrier protein [Casimicrobiaceae bacterium]
MSLTAADVAEILKLLESSSFDTLDLEMGGVKVSLSRGAAGASTAASNARQTFPTAAPIAASAAPAPIALRGDEVIAPLLGTFYRAPKPGASPFVEVGSVVQAETVIGIIEVMKLMNTVRAGRAGRVTEILVTDGALVEYGQPLLHLSAG